MQEGGSSNSTLPPIQNITQEVSHMKQHGVIPPTMKQNHKIVNQRDGIHHDVERHVRIEVFDFSGEHNTNAFLDQKHGIKTYFGWYDMPKEHKLQITDVKLTGTIRIQ